MSTEELQPLADAGGPEGHAYDAAPVALATVTGPSHLLATCNAAYRALVGQPAGAEGTMLEDRWPDPEAQELVELLDHVRRTAEPERVGEWCAFLAPGDAAPSEVYLDVTATPYLAADGTVTGVHLALVDATERVWARRRAVRRGIDPTRSDLDLIVRLQSELLPVALPVLGGLDVSATYLLAPDESRCGGDWFDCIVRADGSVALVVGDVVGGGLSAAAVMSQLRAVLADHLLAGSPVAEAVRRADLSAATRMESRAATVCVVVLDPRSGDLEYCTAGHPPPLVRSADGDARYLAHTGSGPLGVGAPPHVRSDRLGLGDVLVMYSDGLLARPGQSHPTSSEELLGAVRGALADRSSGAGPTQRASAAATSAAVDRVRVTGYVDDIVLLVAERTAPPAPLMVRGEAHPDAVASVREALARWLAPLEADVVDVTAVQHAVGELVTNAVEHSGAEGPGAVSVSASLEHDGDLVCAVTDNGRWLVPGATSLGRGHGLAMVRGLVDRLELSSGDAGTTAVLHHRLHRTAHLLAATTVPAASDDADATAERRAFAVEVVGDRARVGGPLDLSSADELRILLRRAAGRASAGLVVDLSGVTHLGSAGVQVLQELLAADDRVALTASTGTPAQHVLDVARLPYEPAPPT
ncbi:SpoIIE family protein phosphatase [Nocardioides sp. URHA0020]|uniref:SpoIIE family protein phosphatase n=1 Tax=Nocardioides sp. URHA0020 TaxID=1380392 RepID=UPI00068494E7|nr:SpoIIE family protein phosphatase [Nocardioides sp. URHA0020]